MLGNIVACSSKRHSERPDTSSHRTAALLLFRRASGNAAVQASMVFVELRKPCGLGTRSGAQSASARY